MPKQKNEDRDIAFQPRWAELFRLINVLAMHDVIMTSEGQKAV